MIPVFIYYVLVVGNNLAMIGRVPHTLLTIVSLNNSYLKETKEWINYTITFDYCFG